MSKIEWKKIVPMTPKGDPSYITCGGVTELDTERWEWERYMDRRGNRSGPKLGEAGSDEQKYGTTFMFGMR